MRYGNILVATKPGVKVITVEPAVGVQALPAKFFKGFSRVCPSLKPTNKPKSS
jgi:hypothetical protein